MSLSSHKNAVRVGACQTATLLFFLAGSCKAAEIHPEVTISRYDIRLDIRPDGTSTDEIHQCNRVLRPQDRDDLGKQGFAFNSALSRAEMLEAYTITPSGQRIDVAPSAMQLHDANNSQTGFTDQKEISVVYPEVVVGSQVCRHFRREHLKLAIPGVYSKYFLFPPQSQYEKVAFDIRLPETFQIKARGLTGERVEVAQGMRRVHYNFVQLQAQQDESGIDLIDFAPGLFISNAKDYAGFAQPLRQYFRDAGQISEPIRALAQKLTEGLKSPRDKAKVLYQWVNREVRYSNIRIDRGGWLPKSADAVLKDRHGDCKGMAVLLGALLAAVEIESTPVLISAEDTFELPPVPVSYFNHAITYIPGLDVYLDATARQTPFGVVDTILQGKPALLLATGEMKRMPVAGPEQAKQVITTLMRILEDGRIVGQSEYLPIGWPESSSRSVQFDNKGTPRKEVITDLLAHYHETGLGGIETPDPDDLDAEWVVKGEFLLDPVSNIPGPGALRIPVGVAPGALFRLALQRYDDEPISRPYPCASRHIEETTQIDFPASVRITRLPAETQFHKGPASYEAHYSLDAEHNRVTVMRKFVSEIKGPLCSAEDDKGLGEVSRVLQRDLRQQVFYE